MKILIHDGPYYLLRFDTDEEVMSCLIEFAAQEGITAASFTAIGAVKEASVGCYNFSKKKYEDFVTAEDVEISSVIGNISTLDGKPAIHAHGVFSKHDCSCIGGHIKKIIVSATCEVSLTKLNGILERKLDEKFGLNLLK